MSLDLTLIPVDHDSEGWGFGHSLLEWGSGFDSSDATKHLTRFPVPADFATFKGRSDDGESAYGNTQQTPYGEPLQAVEAKPLADALSRLTHGNGWRRAAVVAYLRQMPDDAKIALYWH